MRRLRSGATAVFVSETGMGQATALRIAAIAESNERQIGESVLADLHGGAVATSEEKNGIAPRASLFAVTLEGAAPAPLMLERGLVRIAAEGESPLGRAARRIAQVLTRESGF